MIAQAQDLPPKGATVKAAGLEVVIDKNDNWETVGMVVVLILAIYLGIKLINKYFKDENEKT